MSPLTYSVIVGSLFPSAIVSGDGLLFGSVIAIGDNQPIRVTSSTSTRQITDGNRCRNVTASHRQTSAGTHHSHPDCRAALRCRAVQLQSP
jgi:hypothetical protein